MTETKQLGKTECPKCHEQVYGYQLYPNTEWHSHFVPIDSAGKDGYWEKAQREMN
jgi:hypothetical protein